MHLILQKNAQQLRDLHRRVRDTVGLRNRSPQHHAAWAAAAGELQARYDELAFPRGLKRAMKLLQAGDGQTAAAALSYLENRPYCFGSQYVATALRRALNKIAGRLSPDSQRRFHAYRACEAARKAAKKGDGGR